MMLSWVPGILRAAGLNVVETPGWKTRGHGDMEIVRGILVHHTGSCLHQSAENLCHLLEEGRPGLSGPLANLGLEEDGTYYMIAAGRAYHAGFGEWQGITAGNSCLIGIEAANTGLTNDPWDAPQMDAMRRGCAAMIKHLGAPIIMVAGHKEYALPRGRKVDPSFDMKEFRASLLSLQSPQPKG